MAHLLGVDFGTTNVKAVVFDEQGEVLSQASNRTPVVTEGHLRAHHDPEECWRTMAATIRQAVDGLPTAHVDALCISSLGEAGLFLDEHDRPVYPIIAWFDDRSSPQRDWWRETLGAVEVFRICGVHLDYIFSINKMMWIRDNEPEAFRRAKRWLCVNDYLAWRLTGEQGMSPAIASRTMAFDVAGRRWSGRMLGLARMDASLMPPIVESGTEVGRVTARAAAETGLPAGTPVVVGGHDHLCGALAVNVIGPGPVLNSVGTAEVIMVATEKFSPPGDDPEQAGFSCGCHVVPARYYALGGLRCSGPLSEWLARTLGGCVPGDGSVFARMSAAGLESPAGAKGLFVLPFVSGGRPHRDTEARGVFFGLTTSHTVADIVRAAFEGLSYELRWDIGVMEAFTGARVERLTAIGGGTRNDLWLRVKADITGCPIEISARAEGAALGAALLGGLGIGLYRDVADAARAGYRIERTVEPDATAHERYSDWYESVYAGLYDRLRSAFLVTARKFTEG